MIIFLVYLGLNSPQNSGFNYGLSYIGSVLKKSGYQVSYFSLLYDGDMEFFYNSVLKDQPFIIGFSVTSSQFAYLKHIITEVKKRSNAFIVCGGPHPTLQPESIKETKDVNTYVIGEGEYPMLELASAIKRRTKYGDIKNLCYIQNNTLVKNEIRPLIEDLDDLPYPDIQSVVPRLFQSVLLERIRFIFSRGCPFECSYCCNKAISEIYPNKSKYYRKRSPEKAINEIEYAEKIYKFRSIVFDDDCFALDRRWFYDFIELYRKRFKYPFRCNIRVGTVNEDMVKLLKESGAHDIGIGIEHGNEEFRLKVLKKTITNKQIENTFSLIKKYNITHTDFIMVGMPFETKKKYLDTVKLCRKINAKGRISIFYPYPKTELGEICYKNNWIPDKNIYREREEATIDFPYFSKEEIQLAADAFPFFLENKKIPLKTPLPIVPSAYYLFISLNNIFKFYFNKLLLLLSFQFLRKKI